MNGPWHGRLLLMACVALLLSGTGYADVVADFEAPDYSASATGVVLDGQIGFLRLRGGEVEYAKLVRGTKLAYQDYALRTEIDEIKGLLVAFDDSDWRDNMLMVEPSVFQEGISADDLIGRYIIIKNSERSDASYLIKDVREDGTVISIGDMTLVERFKDASDYEKGVIYNVAEGDEFTVILSASSRVK